MPQLPSRGRAAGPRKCRNGYPDSKCQALFGCAQRHCRRAGHSHLAMIPILEASTVEYCNKTVGRVYLAVQSKKLEELRKAWGAIEDPKFQSCSARRLVSALEKAAGDAPEPLATGGNSSLASYLKIRRREHSCRSAASGIRLLRNYWRQRGPFLESRCQRYGHYCANYDGPAKCPNK